MAEVPASAALSLSWVFGFSRDVPVHNLCDANRSAIFYVSAHTGVIYDLNAKTQQLLQGHCNPITCTCASADRRYIATADRGVDSMLVLWDSYSLQPIKTIAAPHPNGVRAMDLSPDGKYLVTLSEPAPEGAADEPQVLAVWDCSMHASDDNPLFSAMLASPAGEPTETQTSVRLDPSDPTAIVSNGASVVIFWSFADGALTYYSPPLSDSEFKQQIGMLTQSTFLPGTTKAITATSDGDAILWDCLDTGPDEFTTERRAAKVVRLHTGAVSTILTVGEYLVSGGADGFLRFYDFDFRIIAWFEDMDAGSVASISFAVPQPPSKAAASGAVLTCPDFVVGTANALIVSCVPSMFDELSAERRRGTLLVQGQDAAVHGLAAHPTLTRFAVTGRSGLLQLWDYAEKRLLLLRMFDKLMGHTLAFSPNGKFLAIGFTSGLLKVLVGMTLEEVATFKASKGCITAAAFSSDSTYLATADVDNCVGIYRLGNPGDEASAKKEWIYVGKYRGHYKPITGLQFGEGSDGSARLFSTGEDRALVEYDLARSSVQGGIQLRNTSKVEQTAVPTGCVWLPPGVQSAEPAVVTTNDQYKLRVIAPGPKSIQRTVAGPTYGGPLTHMILLPLGEDADDAAAAPSTTRYLAYATHDKVVGLQQLGLDGNPNKAMGLIAHPGEVSDLATTWDGKWLITAGGHDHSIHLWKVNAKALETAAKKGGTGIEPFVAQLDGGAEGTFYEELVDHFYYAQLRAQGEDTTEPRKITGRVPITELGNLMRSLGFYPSGREIDEMVAEAKLVAQAAGRESTDSFTFDEFLVMYVNHRPIFGVSKEQIGEAFAALALDGSGTLSREGLLRVLESHDEALGKEDLEQCLKMLVGEADPEAAIPEVIDAKVFAEHILGFQDYAAAGGA